MQISTAGGAALAELDGDAATARFLLVVRPDGAGGSAGAPDLLAAGDAARQLGGLVARVTEPVPGPGARAPVRSTTWPSFSSSRTPGAQ